MTDREKLIELLEDAHREFYKKFDPNGDYFGTMADHLIANGVTVQQKPRTLEDWGEEYGDVLWWKFPIEEPPYVGSPLDAAWPGYHTHWTPFAVPEEGC